MSRITLVMAAMFLVLLIPICNAAPSIVAPIEETRTQINWNNQETEHPFQIMPIEGWANSTHIHVVLNLSLSTENCSQPKWEKISILDEYREMLTGLQSATIDGEESKHLFQKIGTKWEYKLKNKEELECGESLILELVMNYTPPNEPLEFGMSWGTTSTVVVGNTVAVGDLGRHIVRTTNGTLYVVWKNSTNVSVAKSIDNGVAWDSEWVVVPPYWYSGACTVNSTPVSNAQFSVALDSDENILIAEVEHCASATNAQYIVPRFIRILPDGTITHNKLVAPSLGDAVSASSTGVDMVLMENNSIYYVYQWSSYSVGYNYAYTNLVRSHNNGTTWVNSQSVCAGCGSCATTTTCSIPRMTAYGENASIYVMNSSQTGTSITYLWSFREYRANVTSLASSTLWSGNYLAPYPQYYQACVDDSDVRHLLFVPTVGLLNYTTSANYSNITTIYDPPGGNPLYTPTIACNGTHIYAMATNTSTAYALNYLTSSDNGITWSSATSLGNLYYSNGLRWSKYHQSTNPTFWDYLYANQTGTPRELMYGYFGGAIHSNGTIAQANNATVGNIVWFNRTGIEVWSTTDFTCTVPVYDDSLGGPSNVTIKNATGSTIAISGNTSDTVSFTCNGLQGNYSISMPYPAPTSNCTGTTGFVQDTGYTSNMSRQYLMRGCVLTNPSTSRTYENVSAVLGNLTLWTSNLTTQSNLSMGPSTTDTQSQGIYGDLLTSYRSGWIQDLVANVTPSNLTQQFLVEEMNQSWGYDTSLTGATFAVSDYHTCPSGFVCSNTAGTMDFVGLGNDTNNATAIGDCLSEATFPSSVAQNASQAELNETITTYEGLIKWTIVNALPINFTDVYAYQWQDTNATCVTNCTPTIAILASSNTTVDVTFNTEVGYLNTTSGPIPIMAYNVNDLWDVSTNYSRIMNLTISFPDTQPSSDGIAAYYCDGSCSYSNPAGWVSFIPVRDSGRVVLYTQRLTGLRHFVISYQVYVAGTGGGGGGTTIEQPSPTPIPQACLSDFDCPVYARCVDGWCYTPPQDDTYSLLVKPQQFITEPICQGGLFLLVFAPLLWVIYDMFMAGAPRKRRGLI